MPSELDPAAVETLVRQLLPITERLVNLAPDHAAPVRAAVASLLTVLLDDPSFLDAETSGLLTADPVFARGRLPEVHHIEVLTAACEQLLDLRVTPGAHGLRLRRPNGARRSGSVYTPSPLADTLVNVALRGGPASALSSAEPRSLRVLDPACGTGNLLVAAARHLQERGEPTDGIAGIDLDPLAVALTRRRLRALGVEARIVLADSLAPLGAPPLTPTWDVVLANPPWIAYAGRASLGLDPAVRADYQARFESFGGYPSAHGMFVQRCAELLRPGGRLAVLLPTSVADLHGYRAVRRALTRRATLDPEIQSFGDDVFPSVYQPTMLLGATRRAGDTADADEGPWRLPRADQHPADLELLERLAPLPRLPAALFGERGFHSGPASAAALGAEPRPGLTRPVRVGRDVVPFGLLPPSCHAALSLDLGPERRWREVKILIRQTSRFPVAAPADGAAFRNSVLAGFELPDWPAHRLIGLLNSALFRWVHYQRVRDAREGMPQVKISHLRQLPAPPPETTPAQLQRLDEAALRCLAQPGSPAPRRDLDRVVAEIYRLSPEDLARIDALVLHSAP